MDAGAKRDRILHIACSYLTVSVAAVASQIYLYSVLSILTRLVNLVQSVESISFKLGIYIAVFS